MSNGARHGLGLLVGLVFTPLICLALLYGAEKLNTSFRLFIGHGSDRWMAAAMLVFAAVLIGYLAGSRVSPVAALIPGMLLSVVGLLWIAAPRWMISNTARELPDRLDRGYQVTSGTGVLLMVGVLLFVSGLLPSRWRALQRPARVSGPSPYSQPGQPGQPGPGFGGPQQPPGRPVLGQQPPAHQRQGPPPFDPGARPYPGSPPPAPPQAQHAPAQPPPAQPQPQPQPQAQPSEQQQAQPRQQTDEEAGEWTRMYGGDDFKGSR